LSPEPARQICRGPASWGEAAQLRLNRPLDGEWNRFRRVWNCSVARSMRVAIADVLTKQPPHPA
jgi:hypothetical protein